MDKYNVIVVGGGPSGSIAARTLAQAGVKVLLIDKDLRRVKPCGGATPSKSFKEFNLPVSAISREIKVVSVISPFGYRIDRQLNGGYFAMVQRGEFDRSLREQAQKAGGDLAEAEFLRIRQAGRKIHITVIENGRERNITADFLIAADGINSRTAGALGLKSLPGVYTLQEEVDMQAAEDFQRLTACEFWFAISHASNFYSWVFPKKDHIDIGTGSVDGKTLKSLMKNFKVRRRISGEGRQIVYRLPLKQRDSLIHGNVLFVGDAAGLVMPLSYEGIYYAMYSGRMAAEAIISGMPGDYEKQWNKKFRRQFKLMERLKKYFFKNDKRIEQMFYIHKREKVQQASMRFWLKKDTGISCFLSCLDFFKKIPS